MSPKLTQMALTILAVLLLAACSQPLKAEWIVPANPTPIAIYPPPAATAYHTYLEILVRDVDHAASLASRRARELGGIVENSAAWTTGGRKYISLELSVPSNNFEALRSTLLGLGALISETTVGEQIRAAPEGSIAPYSKVSLQLNPAAAPIPYRPNPAQPGWDPMRTLQSAWQVFVRIFGFLADILIWIVVVAGPFALIGVVIWRLVRRKPKQNDHSDANP